MNAVLLIPNSTILDESSMCTMNTIKLLFCVFMQLYKTRHIDLYLGVWSHGSIDNIQTLLQVKVGVLCPFQQPGSYLDRLSTLLSLVGFKPTEVTTCD